jgi:hypothetical protein
MPSVSDQLRAGSAFAEPPAELTVGKGGVS